jgi:hypothetical protein
MTWTPSSPGTGGFVLWRQGQLVPVLVLGQELPGGGIFNGGFVELGNPDALGRYPIVTQVKENGKTGTGAYRVDADGKLSLIAQSGMTTPLGILTKISPELTSGSPGSGGIAVNQQGQVVLTAQIDKGPDAILLLTPQNPTGSPAP